MAIDLPHGLLPDQIRILQEFRRLGRNELSSEELAAIRHPAGGGESASGGLLEKGFAEAGPGGGLVLTDRGKRLLELDYRPLYERG